MGSIVGALLGALLIKPIGLGITIGSLIGGLLFPSRRKQGPAQFANLQVQTSQKGEPIPVVYGTSRIAGNILWYGNFQRHENAPGGKGGGKGGSPPDPEVRYSASFVVGLCEGPIDDILRIWAGKDEIDMGLEGVRFSIYTGTASQTPDAHIASVMSGTPISVRRESITPPASGTVTDYTAAAPPVASGTAKIFYTHSGGGSISPGTIRRNYTFVTTTPVADQAWITNQSAGTLRVGWPAFTAVTNLQFGYQRTVSSSLTPLAYRHTAYVAFKDWDLGPSATIPNFTFEVQRLVGGITEEWVYYTGHRRGAIPLGSGEAISGVVSGWGGSPLAMGWLDDRLIGIAVRSFTAVRVLQYGTSAHLSVASEWTFTSAIASLERWGGVAIVADPTIYFGFRADSLMLMEATYKAMSSTGVRSYALSDFGLSTGAGWDNSTWHGFGSDPASTAALMWFRNDSQAVLCAVTQSLTPVNLFTVNRGHDTLIFAFGVYPTKSVVRAGSYYYWGHNYNPAITKYTAAGATARTYSTAVIGGAGQYVLVSRVKDRVYGTHESATGSNAVWRESTGAMLEGQTGGGGSYNPVLWPPGAGVRDHEQDVNPVEVSSDWIANTRYGVGMTLAQDADTWSAIRTYCKSHDLFVSPVIADRRRGIEHLEHLLSYFDGIFVWSQGMSKLKARRVESAVASLSDADYVGEVMPSFGRMAQRETRNRLRLEYSNREDDYNRGIAEASDDWSIADTGERAESIALPGITRTSLAQRWIQRALWNRLPQRIMGRVTVGPQRTLLEAGDVITWTHSEVDLRTTRLRVGPIAEAPEQTFGLELIEEPESILGWPAIPGQSPRVTDPRTEWIPTPGDTLAGIFEWPAELNPPWPAGPVLGVVATGPSSLWVGCDIYISRDGISYALLGYYSGRAPFGSISSAMPEVPMGGLYDNEFGQTTVDLGVSFGSVTALGREDMLAATRFAYVGGEFVSFQDVTLVNSYTYALRGMMRGLFDSDVSSKALGSTFFLCGEPGRTMTYVHAFSLTRNDVGRTIYMKFPSVNINRRQDVSSAQAMTFVPTGIGLQPDPVSGLQEDDMPSLSVTGQQSLAFVWRYRQQANVEDVEINSGIVLGKASDFSTYVARLYTSASSAGPWTANTVAEVTSEAFTFVGSLGQHVRIDVTIRDTDGDESPISRRVVAVTA